MGTPQKIGRKRIDSSEKRYEGGTRSWRQEMIAVEFGSVLERTTQPT